MRGTRERIKARRGGSRLQGAVRVSRNVNPNEPADPNICACLNVTIHLKTLARCPQRISLFHLSFLDETLTRRVHNPSLHYPPPTTTHQCISGYELSCSCSPTCPSQSARLAPSSRHPSLHQLHQPSHNPPNHYQSGCHCF